MFKPKAITPNPNAHAEAGPGADLLELWLIPALMALVPERYLVAVWRRLLKRCSLYSSEAAMALYGRLSQGPIAETETWTLGFRLQRALDYGDAFRFWRWPKRRAQNAKPSTLIFGLHWGQGMRALHEQNQQGYQVSFLSGAVKRADYRQRVVRYWYARYRVWVTAKVGGQAVIMTGGAYAQMQSCLEAGKSVWALYDLPTYLQGNMQEVHISDQVYQIPKGLLQLAMDNAQHLLVCTSAYDLTLGGYLLYMEPIAPANAEDLGNHLASRWHEVMRSDERQWHNWQHERAALSAETIG